MSLPSRSADLVLTDPPYHDDVQYDELSLPLRAWSRLSTKKLINEAENVLTDAARASLFKRKLLEHVEGIVAASVKPLEKINDIRIVQMDGLNQAGGGGGSPTDEVINSALRYRVQAPLIDSLLNDIGIDGSNLAKQGGLIREASDMQRVAMDAAKQKVQKDAPKGGKGE